MSIGDNFKNKRIERDLSQEELSKLSGVSKPMISYIEGGKRVPSVLTAQKIARVLRCTIDDLLTS